MSVAPLALAQTATPAGQTAKATAATGQTPTALPATLDRPTLIAWLRTNTDLDPAAVISVSPANIIGLLASNRDDDATKRLYRVQIRSEVISAQTIREGGNASWAADVLINCDTRKGKVNRILDFPMRNLRGAPREAGGSAEFVTPPPGTHLYTVVSAVCDANFQRPLGVVSPRIASVQPAPAPAAAAPPKTSAPVASRSGPPPRGVTAPVAVAAAPTVAPKAGGVDLRPRIDGAAANGTTVGAPRSTPTQPSNAPSAREPGGARAAVQIGASSTEALAARASRTVKAAFPDRTRGLLVSTAPVESNGKTVYRVLFHGFRSTADARAFCTALRGAGRDCLVRDSVGPGARMISAQ
jgi:hypothetical protein